MFDLFSSLVLYKNDKLFNLKKCLAFFFYWLNSLEPQVFVNKNKIILITIKTCKYNRSNNVNIYNVYNIFKDLLRNIE